MTVDAQEAPVGAPREAGRRRGSARWPRFERVPRPEPTTGAIIVSYALTLLSLLLVGIVLNLTVISQFEHWTSQSRLYSELRLSLAQGSTPIGQTDSNQNLVAPGTPVALLQIPRLGVDEVVVEGTNSAQTREGVGHRRDTPLPGQPGWVELLGRQAAYGGVFGDIDQLRAGDPITVTTGEGVAHYRVLGVRGPHTRLPNLVGEAGRLTLITASGLPFVPSGITSVDATLVSKPFGEPAPVIATGKIPGSEKPLGSDTDGAVALSWLLELLLILAVLSVLAWQRWDRRAAWVVFLPLILATSLACADRVCLLLPNLL